MDSILRYEKVQVLLVHSSNREFGMVAEKDFRFCSLIIR